MSPAGDIVHRLRAPTSTDYESILRTVRDLVAVLRQIQPVIGVGVSAPGKEEASGLMTNSNAKGLNGRPFAADLKKVLDGPVFLANDGDCLALSEATDGAAAGAGLVFAAILGTGVGGGIAFEGKIASGKNHLRGEWGHVPLPWPLPSEYPGPRCYCGRKGCLEVFVSGKGLEKDYAQATGNMMLAKQIAIDSSIPCTTARQRYASRLARGLAMVVNILDPNVIVLGGGASNMDFLYDVLPPLMKKWVFGGKCDTPIRQSLHGDSSGVRGAAWLSSGA